MAMTLIHMTELLGEATQRLEDGPAELEFPLKLGAGAVDPQLIQPLDEPHDIEELIAFRCSSL